MWSFQNPVRISFGAGGFEELGKSIDGRRYALVTYPDTHFDRLTARLVGMAGPPVLTVNDVAPNPDLAILTRQSAHLASHDACPDVVVALGGGSVIDSAKFLAMAAKHGAAATTDYLLTKRGGAELHAVPIIAVPTTAGTGSEVTSWATVWDMAASQKHSLAHPTLYPELALIDPALMLAKPRGLTISTGLDALSHALESIWNRNANPTSTAFAVASAREILDVLPRLAEAPGDLALRERMAQAALFAGIAFSNTKTAIAHSLSYPITLQHGVQHGIACSFTLPAILRTLDGVPEPSMRSLRSIFDADGAIAARQLEAFLTRLGIATAPAAYGIADEEWDGLLRTALLGERGQNFAGSAESLIAGASMNRA